MSAPEGSLSTSTSARGAPAGGRDGGAASTNSATGSDVEGEAAPAVTLAVGGDGLGGTPSAATRRSTPEVAASSAAEPAATPAAFCPAPRWPGGPAAAAAAAAASAIDELVGVGGSVLVAHGVPSIAAEARETPPSDADERVGHSSAVGCTAAGGGDAASSGGNGGTPLHTAEAAVGSTVDGNAGLDEDVAAPADGGGEALDHRGEAPLHAAARTGEVEAIVALLDGGAGLHTRTANGDMALHVAVSARQQPALELLLRMSSDGHSGIGSTESTIDVKGANGQTGLCVAADAGWTEGADLLLNAGASASAVDVSGATPLHWAATGGHIDIVEMLLNAGASATVVDGCGRTPDDWAASSGCLKSFQSAVQRCQERRAGSRGGGGGGGSRVNVGGGGYAST